MRLQKFLAQAGITSRRKAEELIMAGKIKINGQVINQLGSLVDENEDQVEYAGKIITLKQELVYYALNKPTGYVSSVSNNEGKSVLNLIKTKDRIYPVGRLDKDSSGLIILTNDGDFTNQLTHAKFGAEKEYFVVLDNDLKPQDIKTLARGMTIDGKKLQPVKVIGSQNKSARLILKEGINRQVRRMLGKLGYTVVKLKRIRMGKLELGKLETGKYYKINKEDVI